MSQYRNIVIEQGESWQMNIYVTDMNGLPLDLTDYTVTMKMKKSYHSKNAISFHTEITDPIKGEIKIWLDETASIKALRYVYECILIGPEPHINQKTTRYMEGIASVTASVIV